MRLPLVAGIWSSCMIFVYWLQGFCNATPVNRPQHGACERLWAQELTLRMMPCYYICVISGIYGPIHTEIRREIDGTSCWDRQYGKCTGGICWKETLSESTKSRHDDRSQIQQQILHRKKRQTYIAPDTDDEGEDWGEPFMRNPTSWPAEGTSSEEEEDEDWETAPSMPSLAPGLKHENLTSGSMPEKSAIVPKPGLLPNTAAASNQAGVSEKSATYANTSHAATGSREPVLGAPSQPQQQASPSTVISNPSRKQRKRRKFRRRRLRGRKRNRKNGKRRRKQGTANKTVGAPTEAGRRQAQTNLPASVINGTQSQGSKRLPIITPQIGPHLIKSPQNTSGQQQKGTKQIPIIPQKSELATHTEEKPTKKGAAPRSTVGQKENRFIEQKRKENLQPTVNETSRAAALKTQTVVIPSNTPSTAVEGAAQQDSLSGHSMKIATGPIKKPGSQETKEAKITGALHLEMQPKIRVNGDGKRETGVMKPLKTRIIQQPTLEPTKNTVIKRDAAAVPLTLPPSVSVSAAQLPSLNASSRNSATGAITSAGSLKGQPGKITQPLRPSLQPQWGLVTTGRKGDAPSKSEKTVITEKPTLEAATNRTRPQLINLPVTGITLSAIPKTVFRRHERGHMTQPQNTEIEPQLGAVDEAVPRVVVNEHLKNGHTQQALLAARKHPALQTEPVAIVPVIRPPVSASAVPPPSISVPETGIHMAAASKASSPVSNVGKIKQPQHMVLEPQLGAVAKGLKGVVLNESITTRHTEQPRLETTKHPTVQTEPATIPQVLAPPISASAMPQSSISGRVSGIAKGAISKAGLSGREGKLTSSHVPLKLHLGAISQGSKEAASNESVKKGINDQPTLKARVHTTLKSEAAAIPPIISPSIATRAVRRPLINVPVTGMAKAAIPKTSSPANVKGTLAQPHQPLQPQLGAKAQGQREAPSHKSVKTGLTEPIVLEATEHEPLKSEAAQLAPMLSSPTANGRGQPPSINLPVTAIAIGVISKTGSPGNVTGKSVQPHELLEAEYGAKGHGLKGEALNEPVNTGLTRKPILGATEHPPLKSEAAPLPSILSPSTAASGTLPPTINIPATTIAEGATSKTGSSGKVIGKLVRPHEPLQQQFRAKAHGLKGETLIERVKTGLTGKPILGATEHAPLKSESSTLPYMLSPSTAASGGLPATINIPATIKAVGAISNTGAPGKVIGKLVRPHEPLQPQFGAKAHALKGETLIEPVKTGHTGQPILGAPEHAPLKSEASPLPPMLSPSTAATGGLPATINIPATATAVGAISNTGAPGKVIGKLVLPHEPLQPQFGAKAYGLKGETLIEPVKTALPGQPILGAPEHAPLKSEASPLPPMLSPSTAATGALPATINIPATATAVGAISNTGAPGNVIGKLVLPHEPLQPQFGGKAHALKGETLIEPVKTGLGQLSLGATEHAPLKSQPSPLPPMLSASTAASGVLPPTINIPAAVIAMGAISNTGSPGKVIGKLVLPHEPLQPQFGAEAHGLKGATLIEPVKTGFTGQLILGATEHAPLKSEAAPLPPTLSASTAVSEGQPPSINVPETVIATGTMSQTEQAPLESKPALIPAVLSRTVTVGTVQPSSRNIPVMGIAVSAVKKKGFPENDITGMTQPHQLPLEPRLSAIGKGAKATGNRKMKTEPSAISAASPLERAVTEDTGNKIMKTKTSALSGVSSPSGKTNVVSLPVINAPITNITSNGITTRSSIESEMRNMTNPLDLPLEQQSVVAGKGQREAHLIELNKIRKIASAPVQVLENPAIKPDSAATVSVLSPRGTLVAPLNQTNLESERNKTAGISEASTSGIASFWASIVRFFKKTIPSYFTRKV